MRGATEGFLDRNRPIVQDSEFAGHVEIVLPANNQTVLLEQQAALDLAGDLIRVTERGNDA